MLEDKLIDIPCPKCGHETRKSVAWIKANESLICEGCGATIKIEAEQFIAGIDEAEKALAKLRKSFGKFGKRR
ncbi:hypothetical protein ASG25_01940 [Rhizobium sp. Leaf384]|nr:hypothetical protein ASG58_17005 [Rhizobium sp. Leaf383]KQS80395.1 hypothetical protein ASG25_01940 [Rhizobium sp. Leaf384]